MTAEKPLGHGTYQCAEIMCGAFVSASEAVRQDDGSVLCAECSYWQKRSREESAR